MAIAGNKRPGEGACHLHRPGKLGILSKIGKKIRTVAFKVCLDDFTTRAQNGIRCNHAMATQTDDGCLGLGDRIIDALRLDAVLCMPLS
jgi:hypothetical protein